jgi:hypothetical protein
VGVVECSLYAKEGRIIGERAVESRWWGEAEAGLLGSCGMLLSFGVVAMLSRAMFVNVSSSV